jgi:hypothetical protein
LKNKQNKNLYIISKHNRLWPNEHCADLADPVRNKHYTYIMLFNLLGLKDKIKPFIRTLGRGVL